MSGTTVVLLRSTDTGAPVLSGTAGALVAVLDACLVNGYNSKTPSSITRSGSTVTVTFATTHGYAADSLTKVEISGADQTEYNGIKQISNVSALSFDFTVTGTPATPATGTITTKAAPLGWSKAFSGTNKAVYRSNEVTGTQLYLRVDDANTIFALARGFETMTDADTGIGLFPTTGQLASGVYINKSIAANADAVNWLLAGDGFEFHFFSKIIAYYSPLVYQQFHFGDPDSEMLSDPYGCLIFGGTGAIMDAGFTNNETYKICDQTNSLLSQTGHYFARSYTQKGGSVAAGKHGNHTLGHTSIGLRGMPYPAQHNNGLYIAPLFVNDGLVLRARLKGIYQPLHCRPFGHGILIASTYSPIGRKLYTVRTASQGWNGDDGETHIDIDGPWR